MPQSRGRRPTLRERSLQRASLQRERQASLSRDRSMPREVDFSFQREREHIPERHLREMQEDFQQMKLAEEKAREECQRARSQLELKEEELRKQKMYILQLNDNFDGTAIRHEEEKNELIRQMEAESRGYRTRNANMSQLVSQLRQDALDEKIRYDELKADYDKLCENNELLLQEMGAMERRCQTLQQQAEKTDAKMAEMVQKTKLWSSSEEKLTERMGRAEALALEMERDTAETHRENDALKAELEATQMKAENLQLQVLEAQKKEGDIRAALSEASATVEQLLTLRRECDELRNRDMEQSELIKELRLEKQKMMQHLQNGIKERQEIIESFSLSGSSANPQLQLKIVECESLKEQLASFVKEAEEAQECISMLKSRTAAAENKVASLHDENRRLRVELELTKEEIQDVHRARRRAEEVKEELEAALQDVTILRNDFAIAQHRQEEALISRLNEARASLSPQHSPR